MSSHSLYCGFIDHTNSNPTMGGRVKKVSKPRERSNAKVRVEAYKELVQGDFEQLRRDTTTKKIDTKEKGDR